MLLNLSELFYVDGKSKDYTVPLEMQELVCGSLSYPVEAGTEVFIHASHSKNRKVKLSVKASVNLIMPCDRCLEDVKVVIPVDSVIDMDLDLSAEQRLENLDEQPYINGYELDVDCLISGEVLLNLPVKVLCSQDCKGICRVCGTNLNRCTCGCDENSSQESSDLPMSTFERLFIAKNIKEV